MSHLTLPSPTPYSLAVRNSLAHFRTQLFSPTATRLATLQPSIERLSNLLSTTLTPSSASLSILLIGPPSSGKSLILSKAISTLPSNPTILTLHGLIHTSPTLVYRSLASQLSDSKQPHEPCSQLDPLAFVNQSIAALAKEKTPILLVFDAFHVFAAEPGLTTVLYSLLNYLQDPTVCAACVAMTHKIDATDRLEKRIKSRFTPREIVVPLPKDADQVLQFLKSVLNQEDQTSSEEDSPQNSDGGTETEDELPLGTRKRKKSNRPSVDSNTKKRVDSVPLAKPKRRGKKKTSPNEKEKNSAKLFHKNEVIDLTMTDSDEGCQKKEDEENMEENRADIELFGEEMDNDEEESEHGADDFGAVANSLFASPLSKSTIAGHMHCNRGMEPILYAVDTALTMAFEPEVLGTGKGDHGRLTVGLRIRLAIQTLEKCLMPADSIRKIVECVSGVELQLLAALRKKGREGGVTFAEVYKLYEGLGREDGMVRGEDGEAVAARVVAEKCWERLVEGGLVVRMGRGPKSLRRVELAVRPGLVDDVVRNHKSSTTRMDFWARQEVRR